LSRSEPHPPSPIDLEKVLVEALRSRGSETIHVRIDSEPIRSNRSWIYRCASSDGGALAVKVYKPEAPKRKARTEFNLLQRFYDTLPRQGNCRIPRPVTVIPEENILVMEWLDAPNMQQVLRRRWLGHMYRMELIESAGRWLRGFHDAGFTRLAPLNAQQIVSRIARRFRRYGRAGFADSRLASVHEATASRAERFSGWPVEYVTAHDDFAARNLLVGQDTVIGIDINGRESWPALADVAHFIFDVDDSGYDGKIFPPWGRCDIESPAGRAFARGYGSALRELPHSLANHLLLIEILRRAALVECSMLYGRGGIRRRPELIRLRRRAEASSRLLGDAAGVAA
jgi:hypothetical protein